METIPFAVIFALNQKDIDVAVEAIKDKLTEDCKLWFCYPKKSSKNYRSEINRDHGWQPLGDIGFEPVRQVAIYS